MESLPLRRLLTGPEPAPARIFFTSIWFKGHNNPRYAELLPRLDRLDSYLVTCSDERIVRGLQYRAYRWSRPVLNPVVMTLAGRRYRSLFTADNEQIAAFPGSVVSDVDDPRFTEREVEQLNRTNVAAYVVTAERAARRLESLGVHKPYHVAAGERKSPDTVVVGYMSALMLTAEDRDGDKALYNVDHLLDLWEEVRLRAPHARLWLVGGASERVLRRIGSRDDIVAFGRLERHQALAHTANFDIALYPREKDEGIQAAKTAEYMGLGVPTVSYDYVDAVVQLIEDPGARQTVASAAAAAGRERSWDALAAKYRAEILDRYLA